MVSVRVTSRNSDLVAGNLEGNLVVLSSTFSNKRKQKTQKVEVDLSNVDFPLLLWRYTYGLIRT